MRPELPVRVLTAVAVRVRAVALTEAAVAAAPAPTAAVAVPAEDTPEAVATAAVAEAVEAAVLPPAEAADADKTKRMTPNRGHPFSFDFLLNALRACSPGRAVCPAALCSAGRALTRGHKRLFQSQVLLWRSS